MFDLAQILKYKIVLVNAGLLVFLILYILFGAVCFHLFETTDNAARLFNESVNLDIRVCLTTEINKTLQAMGRRQRTRGEHFEPVLNHCLVAKEGVPKWSFGESVAFSFSIITVLGFGSTDVITTGGQLFYLFYAVIGIPSVMLILANFGRFLGDGVLTFYYFCRRKRRNQTEQEGEDDHSVSEDDELQAKTLLIMFAAFFFIGSFLITFMRTGSNPIRSIYASFRAITADFAEIMPKDRFDVLPLALLYVTLGNMLLTMAIDVASVYLRKVHSFGVKLKNVSGMSIWFGAEKMPVGQLLTAVCRKLDLPPDVLDEMNLDEFIEDVIAHPEMYERKDLGAFEPVVADIGFMEDSWTEAEKLKLEVDDEQTEMDLAVLDFDTAIKISSVHSNPKSLLGLYEREWARLKVDRPKQSPTSSPEVTRKIAEPSVKVNRRKSAAPTASPYAYKPTKSKTSSLRNKTATIDEKTKRKTSMAVNKNKRQPESLPEDVSQVASTSKAPGEGLQLL